MRNERMKVVGITLKKDFAGKRNFMTHIVCIVVKWTLHDTCFFLHIYASTESCKIYKIGKLDAIDIIKNIEYKYLICMIIIYMNMSLLIAKNI